MALVATPTVSKLLTILIEDLYGELPARIFSVLLFRGRLPHFQILRSCSLPPSYVANGLTILIQLGLVFHYSPSYDELMYYEANINGAYELLRVGKNTQLIENRYGNHAADVVANLLFFGHARKHEVLCTPTIDPSEAVGADSAAVNGASVDNNKESSADPAVALSPHEEAFQSLLQSKFVEEVRDFHFLSPFDFTEAVGDLVQEEHSEFKGLITGPSKTRAYNKLVLERKKRIRDEDEPFSINTQLEIAESRPEKKQKLEPPNNESNAREGEIQQIDTSKEAPTEAPPKEAPKRGRKNKAPEDGQDEAEPERQIKKQKTKAGDIKAKATEAEVPTAEASNKKANTEERRTKVGDAEARTIEDETQAVEVPNKKAKNGKQKSNSEENPAEAIEEDAQIAEVSNKKAKKGNQKSTSRQNPAKAVDEDVQNTGSAAKSTRKGRKKAALDSNQAGDAKMNTEHENIEDDLENAQASSKMSKKGKKGLDKTSSESKTAKQDTANENGTTKRKRTKAIQTFDGTTESKEDNNDSEDDKAGNDPNEDDDEPVRSSRKRQKTTNIEAPVVNGIHESDDEKEIESSNKTPKKPHKRTKALPNNPAWEHSSDEEDEAWNKLIGKPSKRASDETPEPHESEHAPQEEEDDQLEQGPEPPSPPQYRLNPAKFAVAQRTAFFTDEVCRNFGTLTAKVYRAYLIELEKQMPRCFDEFDPPINENPPPSETDTSDSESEPDDVKSEYSKSEYSRSEYSQSYPSEFEEIEEEEEEEIEAPPNYETEDEDESLKEEEEEQHLSYDPALVKLPYVTIEDVVRSLDPDTKAALLDSDDSKSKPKVKIEIADDDPPRSGTNKPSSSTKQPIQSAMADTKSKANGAVKKSNSKGQIRFEDEEPNDAEKPAAAPRKKPYPNLKPPPPRPGRPSSTPQPPTANTTKPSDPIDFTTPPTQQTPPVPSSSTTSATVAETEHATLTALVTRHLTVLTYVEPGFVTTYDPSITLLERTSTDPATSPDPTKAPPTSTTTPHPAVLRYTTNFTALTSHYTHQLTLSVLTPRFGPHARLLLSLLHQHGHLQEPTLSHLTLTPFPQIRPLLHALFDAGYATCQEIPRDNSRVPQRTVYIWGYDADRAGRLTKDGLVQGMVNLLVRMRLEKGRDAVAKVLEKCERSDYVGREREKLSEREFKVWEKWRDLEMKTRVQLDRLDGLLSLFGAWSAATVA